MDSSLFLMCLITALVFFFAIIYCLLSTCIGVDMRRHLSELDFSWKGILDAIAFNAPQAREARRKAGFGAGLGRGRRPDERSREESYEMMGWNRAGANQGRRAM